MTSAFNPGQTSQSDRIEGFLVGAVVGAALAAATADCHDVEAVQRRLAGGNSIGPLGTPPGHRFAATALSDGLMEELLSGGVDLHRLAARWLEWWQHDGFAAEPGLARALDHLRDFDAPTTEPGTTGAAAIAASLPAALTAVSPQGMVAGAFHVAGLLDPSEEGGLAAVAVVVTAAKFLEGRRDFIADVIAVLRANEAPDMMLDAVRAIPRDPRNAPRMPRGEGDVVTTLIWLLWTVHHRPRGLEALHGMAIAGGVSPTSGAVLGALMGARDGMASWPDQWLLESGEDAVVRRGLARRLTMDEKRETGNGKR